MPSLTARKKALARKAKTYGIRIPRGFVWFIPRNGRPTRKLIVAVKRWKGIKPYDTSWSPALVELLFPTPAHVKRFLEVCEVSYEKRALIHYSYPAHTNERWMGISHRIRPPRVPTWADCSSWAFWVWWACGFPDPTNTGYGWGTSESIYYACKAGRGKFVRRGREQVGDWVIYRGGVGHAELVIAPGLVLSNGQEAGPEKRPLGVHSGQMYICRFKPFL